MLLPADINSKLVFFSKLPGTTVFFAFPSQTLYTTVLHNDDSNAAAFIPAVLLWYSQPPN